MINCFNYVETRKRGDKTFRFLVYVITSTCTEQMYVGCTTQRIAERWRCHKKDANLGHRNCHLQKALLTFDISSFSIHVLGEYNNKQEMLIAEKLWMLCLNTIYPNGFNENKHSTVNYGWKQTLESRKKISEGNKGKKRSLEMSNRQSERQRGKSHSEEHKRKIALAQTNRVYGADFSEKMRQTRIGLRKVNGKMIRL